MRGKMLIPIVKIEGYKTDRKIETENGGEVFRTKQSSLRLIE